MTFLTHLRRIHKHNISTLYRQPLLEISGSLGDLGTLLPLLIALTWQGSIDLSSTLVFTGLANIATGVLFGIPLPVQPMKAIAAVAINRGFSITENAAAGLTVSVIVLILSITGLLNWFSRVIPVPVVKGIQVGAGLSLILSGGTSLLAKLDWYGVWWDNLFWTVFAFMFLLAATACSAPYTRLRIPYALIVVLIGLVLVALNNNDHHDHDFPRARFWTPHLWIPDLDEFGTSLSASLGQLPLTTLNSIIAVSHLSAELLPDIPIPSSTALGLSVATMNLVSGWFGGMPACHGSGGLAGQYRFGARSGASIIILGLVKLVLGLFFGDGLMPLMQYFPKSLLGVMVIAAGVELAKVGESLNNGATDLWEISMQDDESESGEVSKRQREVSDDERKERWSVMLVTVAGMLAFRNDGIGFIVGMIWHFGLQAPEYMSRLRLRRSWMGTQHDEEHAPLTTSNND